MLRRALHAGFVLVGLVLFAPVATVAEARTVELLGARAQPEGSVRFLEWDAPGPHAFRALRLLELPFDGRQATHERVVVAPALAKRRQRAGLKDVHGRALREGAARARDAAELDGYRAAEPMRCYSTQRSSDWPPASIAPASARSLDATWSCLLAGSQGGKARLALHIGRRATTVRLAASAAGSPLEVASIPHRSAELRHRGQRLLPGVELDQAWRIPATDGGDAFVLVLERRRPRIAEIEAEHVVVLVAPARGGDGPRARVAVHSLSRLAQR